MLGVGPIKWLENATFDGRDHAALLVHRSQLPGADDRTPVFALARAGTSVADLRCYGPEELLATW